MAMDATLQIRIDSAVKEQVEALYRNLGTSFAEAVRMFAQQSLQEGGMPFRPSLRAWDDMSEAEISEKLSRSSEDIAAGRISAQCDMDAKVKELLQVVPQRYKIFYTSTAERDITEKPMYIMQQYRDTVLAERCDNAFALCYRRI